MWGYGTSERDGSGAGEKDIEQRTSSCSGASASAGTTAARSER